jgi:hypothetical protein
MDVFIKTWKLYKRMMGRCFVCVFFLCSVLSANDFCQNLGLLLLQTFTKERRIGAPKANANPKIARFSASRFFNRNVGMLPDLYEEYDPADFLAQYQEIFRVHCQPARDSGQYIGRYIANSFSSTTACIPSFDLRSKGFTISHIIDGCYFIDRQVMAIVSLVQSHMKLIEFQMELQK